MTNNQSTVRNAIIITLEENNDQVEGTENLTLMLNAGNSKSWIIRSARVLQSNGQISIIRSNGGRGRKTVYRRNRNSPGQARKRKP